MYEREPDQNSKPVLQVTGWKRVLFLILAAIFFLLGAAGAFLPGLPGTPFLLLTSYFLVRSFPSLNERLLQSRLFGPILRDWQHRGGVRRDIKVKAIVIVVAAIGVSLWFSRDRLWLCGLMILLASIGIIVILKLPTLPDSEEGAP